MSKILNSIKLNNYFLTILITLVYIFEYHYVYYEFVIKVFGYMGFTYQKISGIETILYFVVEIIPIIFYIGFRNISSALSIFTYIFIYIPFIETIFTAILPLSLKISYGLLFFFLMILFFMTDKSIYCSKFISKRGKVLSFKHIEIIIWSLMLLTVLLSMNKIRFVNILSQASLMYELRSDNNANRSIYLAYLISWLGHAFIPILLVTYYVGKKKIRFYLTILAYLFIFMMDMQKITFVIPFAMWLLLYLNSKHKYKLKTYFHLIIMLGLLIPSFVLCKIYEKRQDPITLGLTSLMVLRTQCIAGEQLDRYLQFFEINDNPYTKYTHINTVNTIFKEYPYGDESIGEVVAGDGTNSNATFLLMDGIAAFGIIGTFIIGILFIVFKGLMNSLGEKYDHMYIIIILLFGIFSMLNTSLFTSILSFGFLLVYVVLLKSKISLLEKSSTKF